VIAEHPQAFGALFRYTLQAFIQPTRVPIRPKPARQVIMGTWAEDQGTGFALMLDETGALTFLLDGTVVSTRIPLTARRWYHVGAAVDLAAETVTLCQTPLADHAPSLERPVSVTTSFRGTPAPRGEFFLGAARRAVEDGRLRTMWHFNGKIDRPSLARRALTPAEMQVAATAPSTLLPAEDAFGLWDFAADTSTDRVTDRSPFGLHGRTVNAPERAVTGHNWNGTEMDWRRAPQQYGAMHFHDDDLYDAGWRPSLTTTIPADTRSGVYALRLQADGSPDFWAVFYVRPPRRGRRAPVAFLASTATYLAYSNYRARMRPGPAELYIGALPVVDPTDLLLMHHPELGGSTYDTHSDGSGVCHVSWRRPILNVRPTGRLWNLFLDFCLLDWLEAHDQPYDVITDDDLHTEGRALLADYKVILTGCHPEYYSREMLDALAGYLGRGGRLMYMGGNGFYWRVSYPSAHPGMIEVRRAEDAGLGRSGRRVLSQLDRRVRWPLATAGPGAQRAGRRGLRGAGVRPLVVLPAHHGQPQPSGALHLRRGGRRDPRRLRAGLGGRRRARARRVQPRPGIAAMGVGGRVVGRALQRLSARQRGDERVVRGR
jgi:N,N-dimethylformamidase